MKTISRRRFIQSAAIASASLLMPRVAFSDDLPGIAQLKAGYAARIKKILAAGELPYIDIESSCSSRHIDIDKVAEALDRCHIGAMALSADLGKKQFENGVRYDPLSRPLVEKYPDRFIPVGNGGQPPALTEDPAGFLDAQKRAAERKEILLFGEFEIRHYPSPRQAKRGEAESRDVNVAIDGPVGEKLFGIAGETGLAFQLHYEIEDALLPPLEKMLAAHPKARVIWCHVAQVRYSERAPSYDAKYVDSLIGRFPNLYFDTAFGSASSVYPLSNQRHSRIWGTFGGIKDEWKDLIVAHPGRFMSALDLGGDRLERISEYNDNHRRFLKELPESTRHEVAYRSAWSLLFGEEFS